MRPPKSARGPAGVRSRDAITVRVVDDEIQVRGPNVMAGYLNAEEDPFTDDGYYRTGDLGRETDLGFEYLSRGGDALRSSGFLVHPREIEAFLESAGRRRGRAVVAHEGHPVAFVLGKPDESRVIEQLSLGARGLQGPAPRDRARFLPHHAQRERRTCAASRTPTNGRRFRGLGLGYARTLERLQQGETSHMSSLAEPGWEAIARYPQFRELVVEPAALRRHRDRVLHAATSSSIWPCWATRRTSWPPRCSASRSRCGAA